MLVPPGRLMQGAAHTTDEEDEATDERDEFDVDEVEERDDEDIEVELAAEEEAPADDPADEAIDEFATEDAAEDSDELLPELPVPDPGLNTSLLAPPQAERSKLAITIVVIERIFIGNSHSG
jgi:hypothetical protein